MTSAELPNVPSAGSPWWAARSVSRRLPDFPWDRLVPFAEQARSHPDGIVDLSVGTPVDPTPDVVSAALAAAADSPGYPTTVGREDLRRSCVAWMERRLGVTGVAVDAVLPTIGSKELIASLALHLGVGSGDLVVLPRARLPDLRGGGGAGRGAHVGHRLPCCAGS